MPTPKPRPTLLPTSLVWAQKFIPHYFTHRHCQFHVELMIDLQNKRNRLLARVAPRGHGKSVLSCLAYPLWCICERKARSIVIITRELSLATQFVRDLRTELESNQLILDTYGDLTDPDSIPDDDGVQSSDLHKRGVKSSALAVDAKRSRPKWSEHKFTTVTGISVQAKGVGASFRGARVGRDRPDLILCDDIEKDELVMSAEQRQKLEHWVRHVLMPALAPTGRLLILGSLLHYDSLLTNLADKTKWNRWDHKVYRALEVREGTLDSGVQSSALPPGANATAKRELCTTALWPERWPVKRLEEERERIGTRAFEQEYQGNPVDDSMRVFRPEWLGRCTPAEIAELDAQNRLTNLMAVDPATGAEGGDYFALWVGGVDRATGVIYTRELRCERIGVIDQVRRIAAAYERWKPVKVGVETTAYQAALKQLLDEHSRTSGLYMPVEEIRPVGNKRARIEGSSAVYENGSFRLPAGLTPEIEAQFLQFPKSRHDDGPDVCAMGIELARVMRPGKRSGAEDMRSTLRIWEQVKRESERRNAW